MHNYLIACVLYTLDFSSVSSATGIQGDLCFKIRTQWSDKLLRLKRYLYNFKHKSKRTKFVYLAVVNNSHGPEG